MASSSLDNYRLVASSLGLRTPALFVLKRVAWVDHFYHLTAPLSRLRFPRLRLDLSFAPATEDDFDEMAQGLGALDPAARKDVVTRLLFRRRGFSGCYVGRSAEGDLVSVQWLVRPRENPLLQVQFPRLYYPLRDGEVMLENVFVYPRFRGIGVFPTVNHHVVSVARSEGFRGCHAYIRKDNLVSLNGFLSMGFQLQRLLTGYNLAGLSWRNL
jgi:hypothetical protein